MTKRVDLIERKILWERSIFRIEEARFRQELPGGGMSSEVVRLNLDRGDSVAAVIHDTQRNSLIMVEQFRYPTHEKGPGWTLELPAGIIDRQSGETPERTMQRELVEEIGYHVDQFKLLQVFYPSPGGSSERIYLYYARVTDKNHQGEGGGVPSSGEFIRRVSLPIQEALEKMDHLEIMDAKTIIGLQWLKLMPLDERTAF